MNGMFRISVLAKLNYLTSSTQTELILYELQQSPISSMDWQTVAQFLVHTVRLTRRTYYMA